MVPRRRLRPALPTLGSPALGVAALGLFVGCGSATSPSTPTSSSPEHGAAAEPVAALEAPVLDPRDTPPRATGAAPAVSDLASAWDAARHGWYDVAEAWATGPGATAEPDASVILRARIGLERGRYDEVASLVAGLAAGEGDAAIAAATILGEARAARGRLDEAEAAFRKAANGPTAWRARGLLGRLLGRRGRGVEARAVWYELVAAYNDGRIDRRDADGLEMVAIAAWGLGSARDANDAFRESAAADPDRVETQLEWAELFLEKYDPGNAEASVRQALSTNAESALGHALMARVRIAQRFDFEAAEAYLARALEVNPALVVAHVTLAGSDLRDRDFEAADAHLAEALAVDAVDLEALSVRAAVRFVDDDAEGFAAAERAVLRQNAGYSRFYTLVADYADWEHRYPEMVELARKGVVLRPDDGLAHATLGLNLLRLGDEDAGLEALRDAWRRDRFNVQVFNTLELYDDVIATQYEDFASGPFVIRMHRDERSVLSRYAPAHFERAWDDMVARYGFTPAGPVRVELYASPEHFSVRTAGLPHIGVQGVCFGKVVTALSPRGGPFDWGEITWHELAHVFHIQRSRNRVPRWFTEGLAEWETGRARADWKREDDHRLWEALDAGRLPPLRLLNHAFTHARSAEDATLAYYAATMAVTYLIDRYDFRRVVGLLDAWGRGRSTDAATRDVLGEGIDALDAGFRDWLRERLSARAGELTIDLQRYEDLAARRDAAAARPRDAEAQGALAAALLVAGERGAAEAAARKAIALDPGQPLARVLLARKALASQEPDEAAAHLAALPDGVDGYALRVLAARIAIARSRPAEAIEALRAATRLDGDRAEAWQGLAELAERSGDEALRLSALQALVAIDQHDRAGHRALLDALVEAGSWPEVRDLADRMLTLDPYAWQVHAYLAEGILRTRGDRSRAQDELGVAAELAESDDGRAAVERIRALLEGG